MFFLGLIIGIALGGFGAYIYLANTGKLSFASTNLILVRLTQEIIITFQKIG